MIPEFKFNGRKLTNDESSKFIGLCMNKDKEIPAGEDPALSELFLAKIFLKRLEFHKCPFMVTNFFLVMSMLCFARSPGQIILLLRLCWQHWKKTGKTLLGVEEWADMFPMGPPTDEELHAMWDAQKKEGEPLGNMLDNNELWNS